QNCDRQDPKIHLESATTCDRSAVKPIFLHRGSDLSLDISIRTCVLFWQWPGVLCATKYCGPGCPLCFGPVITERACAISARRPVHRKVPSPTIFDPKRPSPWKCWTSTLTI